MRQILAIIEKELIQIKRDPKILPILFIAPVFQLLILGYAATTDVKLVALAVCDFDGSAISRSLVSAFTSSHYFSLAGTVPDQRQLDRLLASGKARLGLTIPPGFGAAILRGESASVQILVDGSDATSATAGLAYAQKILTAIHPETKMIPLVELRPVVLYNPDLISRNFMEPGVLAMIIMVTSMMLSAMALVRERELGSWEQLMVTPLSPRHILLGKLLPYGGVAFIEIATALPVLFLVFHIPFRGSIGLILALSTLFVLATLGLGIFVSTLSRTQQQAMMLSAFVFMLPQIYLSGFIFPIENMPKIFQAITYAVPLRYFVTILRGVFLKGVGLDALWSQALALLALDAVILLAARFRWQQTVG